MKAAICRSVVCKTMLICTLFFCVMDGAQATTGDLLRNAMIWHPDTTAKTVGFRKQFTITGTNTPGTVYIFADSRYMLWINGVYVMRGPCRFDPKRPEYDSFQVSKYLHAGSNTIAVLVYGNMSSGEAMKHAPGLGLMLQSGSMKIFTNADWRCSNATRFEDPYIMWDGIKERVHADKEDGDWVMPAYNDAAWPVAVLQNNELWGKFYSRITPLQAAKDIPFNILGKELPFEVKDSTNIFLRLDKNIMGYCIFDFDADEGSKLEVFGHQYTAKQGRQEYITADVYGSGMTRIFATEIPEEPDSVCIPVYITKGRIRFTNIKVFNFVAPLKLAGAFHSSDSMLNRFWDVITNMHAQITQDTYTDGASEGNEWVADVHNISQFTRVAFEGLDDKGHLLYGDKRFLKKALSDFAISQQPDGRIKAHHPSDRFDLHWFIEDFACIWISDIKTYYETTGDKAFITRLWPAVKKQMNWFKDSITARGLVHGREWCIFDNPYAYIRGEGATMNAFIFKAYNDAAYLAKICGEENTASDFSHIAAGIKNAFNKYLWSESQGSFMGMKDSATTTHAAVMALYTGVCEDKHKEAVEKWLMKRNQDSLIIYPFLHLFWFKCLYDMNTDEADQQVLDIIHDKYNNKWNAYNKGYLTAESCNAGRNFHNFGMVPGYFLSAYLLGVRPDGPVWDKRILIEPRLADMLNAEGTVVTDYGLVRVSWRRTNKDAALNFSFTVPNDIIARVGIPKNKNQSTLMLNGQILVNKGKPARKGITITKRFIYLDNETAGTYSGKLY